MTTPTYKVSAAGEGLLHNSEPGERQMYKVWGEDTNGAMDVFILGIQPNSGPPLQIHHHHQNEAILFVKGSYKVQLHDEKFDVKPAILCKSRWWFAMNFCISAISPASS